MKRIILWLLPVLLTGYLLQNIPGTYLLDDFDLSASKDSPEGMALQRLESLMLEGTLYFEEAARHRISRNAELLVPAGTRLTFTGSGTSEEMEERIGLNPEQVAIIADQPLTFIYRQVNLARSQRLETTPEGHLNIIGHYRVLSALRTAYRYQRQREVRRDFKIPAHANLNLRADFRDLTPALNQALHTHFSEEILLGNSLALQLKAITQWSVPEDNYLDIYFDSRIRYARSERISSIMQPRIKARIGVELDLPEDTDLAEAELGVTLARIHTLDFKGGHPLLDRATRGIARSRQDQASFTFNLREEITEIETLPGSLYIRTLRLMPAGPEGENAGLEASVRWTAYQNL